MPVSDSTLLAQMGATIAQATAGVLAWHGAHRMRRDGLLATALLVGAALTAIDTMNVGSAALPLAAWALIAFGLVGTFAGRHVAHLARPLPCAALAAIAFVLLHGAHTAFGGQPGFGTTNGIWYPLDLSAAMVLGWLAVRGNASPAARKALATNAIGLGLAAFCPAPHAELLAATQIAAAWPLVARAARIDVPIAAITTAGATLFGLTCALRAATDAVGHRPLLTHTEDPLLLLAIGSALFTVALLRANLGSARTPTPSRNRASRASTGTAGPSTDIAPTTNSAAAATVATATMPTASIDLAPPTPTPAQTQALTTREVLQDLRQPITSMLAAAGLVTTSKEPEELAAQVEALRLYGEQLTTAIDDLEDFERLLQGRVEAADETFDVRLLLESCVAEVAPAVADRSIELRLDLARTLPRWVQGDATRTRQLLVRMLQSIARHASFGPIDITAGADEMLHVSVLGRTAALPEAGRGLALAFCRQLATLLGGELQVSTLPELGAELRLCLPKRLAPEWEVDLVDEDNRSSAPGDNSLPVVSGRVLLVDESPDHLHLLGKMLAKAGAQVSTANSGELALHLLASTSFDLVFIEMQLANQDGYTTVQKLREQGVTTPIIALTAATAPADVERSLAAGCNGLVGKPVDLTLLRRTLAMHLPTAVS